MKYAILIAFLLFLSIASASHAVEVTNYSMIFNINNDFSVDETIRISFSENVSASNLSYSFKGEATNIEMLGNNENLNFIIARDKDSIIMKPIENRSINNILIKFRTNNLIFKLGEKNLFFSQLSTESAKSLIATVTLPEG